MTAALNRSINNTEGFFPLLSKVTFVCFHLFAAQGSVRALLHEKIRDAYTHPQFITDVMKPMQIESIIDQNVRHTQVANLISFHTLYCNYFYGNQVRLFLIHKIFLELHRKSVEAFPEQAQKLERIYSFFKETTSLQECQ